MREATARRLVDASPHSASLHSASLHSASPHAAPPHAEPQRAAKTAKGRVSAVSADAGVDTGRITRALDRRAREMLFGGSIDQALREEIPHYTRIDRAHLVMLVECGLLPRDRARALIAAITELIATDYAPLRGRAAPRGAYLAYEHWLSERLGESTGGALHLARSRNDINATVLRLRLRPVVQRLLGESLRLLARLTARAARYASVTMPIYTHYQAALPITYGHYLAGVAVAIRRDVQGIEDAVRDLDRCPLGAGAGGGTDLPIDPRRTAQLLGFDAAVTHSVDAVASRDLVLRLLAAAGVLGVTLSRLATDLQVWSSAEFDLIRFPDSLVGSSSMLPQKRNAFLLEHIKGRGGAPLGAFTAAAMAMHATPFSNSVATGTEGVKPCWSALAELTEAIVLATLVVDGGRPRVDRMRTRAADGFTAATVLANRLVLTYGLSFRQAHHRVGALVTEACARGESLVAAAQRLLRDGVSRDAPGARDAAARGGAVGDAVVGDDADGIAAAGNAADGDVSAWLDPERVAAASAFGGGPARAPHARLLDDLREQAAGHARALARRARSWRAGERRLQQALATLADDADTADITNIMRAADPRRRETAVPLLHALKQPRRARREKSPVNRAARWRHAPCNEAGVAREAIDARPPSNAGRPRSKGGSLHADGRDHEGREP